jgi:hydroxyacylglutathione hydrolase
LFKKLPVGNFLTNCYVIADDVTREAAIIDPADDFERLKSFIETNSLKVKYILLTHAHGDHILALPEIKAYTHGPVGLHKYDEEMLENGDLNMSGTFKKKTVEEKGDFFLEDGMELWLGNKKLTVLHTPGHTRGSVCILSEGELVSGDTLFADGIGRTDLYGGSYESILESIRTKLFVLDGDTRVHPGHGASTTIRIERENNPFF